MRLDLTRLPFRFNWRRFPRFDTWPNSTDPRLVCDRTHLAVKDFERAVSQFKVDTAWKMTSGNRHPLTDQKVVERATPNSVILDVGASSGRTSLDLLDKVGSFARFYVTDLYFTIPFHQVGGATYFYHPRTKQCVLRITNRSVTYRMENAWLVLDTIAKRLIAGAPQYDRGMREANLVHPELLERAAGNSRIIVKEYDVFARWDGPEVDIVKVANVLNREYFSADQIREAMRNLGAALKIGGTLVATDNKDVEKVSVFTKTERGLRRDWDVNGGSGVAVVMRNHLMT